MYTIHYVISCLFRFIELYVQYTRSLVQRTSMYEYKHSTALSTARQPRLWSYKYKKCIMAFVVGCIVCRGGRFEWLLRSPRLVGRARPIPKNGSGTLEIPYILVGLGRIFELFEVQGWKNITITPLVIVSYRYFYITITNESSLINNEN